MEFIKVKNKLSPISLGLFMLMILVIGFFPSRSYATKARMDALGGGDTAYYYFNDTNNILFNPAYVNINKDFLIFEWGKDIAGASLGDSTPKPEGGFFNSIGTLNYGVYLGHEEGYEGRDDVGATTPPSYLYQDNPFEIFIAGDTGLKWGTSLKFTHNMDDQTGVKRKESSLKAKFGIMHGNLEGKLSIDLFDKSEGGSTQQEAYKGELGYEFAINYFLRELSLYGKFSQSGYEYYRASDGRLNIDKDVISWTLGAGQKIQLNEKAKMYGDIHFEYTKNIRDQNLASVGQKVKSSLWKIPFTLALETSIKDWLVLRGSLSQNIFSKSTDTNNKSTTIKSSTVVSAGAGLDLGQFKMDGLIGTTDANGNDNKAGVLSLANLLAKVGVVYWY